MRHWKTLQVYNQVKNAQLAAKAIETVKTPQGEVKVPLSFEKPKGSGKEAAKKIIKKYDKIRCEKKHRKLAGANEKKKKQKILR